MHIVPILLAALICLIISPLILIESTEAHSELEVGFYDKSCPRAEEIIRNEMIEAIGADSGNSAGILRLHFHDCFIRGCDGSALLAPTPENKDTEMTAAFSLSLRGYQAIDTIKARLEEECKQTVSCADLLAFAARDSIALSGGLNYQVPAGRRDGSISRADEADQAPRPILSLDQLIDNFAVKGLNVEDMVVLSGSHTIGVVHCGTLTATRLFNFSQTYNISLTNYNISCQQSTGESDLETDPALNPSYAGQLKLVCPEGGDANVALPMDPPSPLTFDNSYYKLLLRNLGVLHTDQELMSSPATAAMVKQLAADDDLFQKKFAAAMVKMGEIGVMTGENNGEIHTDCKIMNK